MGQSMPAGLSGTVCNDRKGQGGPGGGEKFKRYELSGVIPAY